MGSCCHKRSASNFFTFFADRYCRRSKKKGFEASQKQLMEGLEQVGFADASILDIGCGVGHLHQSLLEQGAQQALGVDLTPRMLELAGEWASERGLSDRVTYLEGDFVDLANAQDDVDLTLLDKVICCDPDYETLLGRSLEKTRRVYAYTIPRDLLFNRLWTALESAVLWMMRSDFRSFVHDPQIIHNIVGSAGFKAEYENTTLVWLTRVYAKTSNPQVTPG